METSSAPIGKIGKSDWLKAFITFVISTVTSFILDALVQAFSAGQYSLALINWQLIGSGILIAVLTYIQKQLTTNSQGDCVKSEPN